MYNVNQTDPPEIKRWNSERPDHDKTPYNDNDDGTSLSFSSFETRVQRNSAITGRKFLLRFAQGAFW